MVTDRPESDLPADAGVRVVKELNGTAAASRGRDDHSGPHDRGHRNEADDLAVDEAIGVTLASSGPWTAGTKSSMGGACRVPGSGTTDRSG